MQLDVSILIYVANHSSLQATAFGTDQARFRNLNLYAKQQDISLF